MNPDEVIPGILDALGGAAPEAAESLLPTGDATAVIARAADEAEARIMADLPRAVKLTGGLVALADRRAGAGVRARARRVHAQALTYANQFDQALEVLTEAGALALEAGDRVEEGRGLLTMLHVFARQTRFDDAVACGARARDAFAAAQERVLVGRAENNLGIVERMRDRPATAILHFEKASVALAEQPPLLAHVENNRAEALLDLDRFAEAERAFGSALAAFRSAGGHRHAGIVLGNLADLTSRQGRLHESLALFEEARRAMGEAAAPGDEARLKVEQADVLATLGMLAQAAAGYREAIPILEQHSMAAEGARARFGLGRVLSRLDDPGAAAELARAEAMFAGVGNESARARALAAIADTAAAARDFARARELLTSAREAVRTRPAAAAWVDLLTARVLLEQGDAVGAAELAAGAGATAEGLHLSPLAADLLHTRGRALLVLGRAEQAWAVLRRAVQHAERCRGTLQADMFRAAFVSQRAPIWEDAATAALESGAGAAEAFAMVEMAKGRSLLDVLAAPGLQGSGDDDLVVQLARTTAELNVLYARAWEASEQASSADRTVREIAEHELRAEAIQVRLGAAATFGGSFASPPAMAEVQRVIPADGAVVEYFAEAGWLSAFVLTRGEVRVRRKFATLDVARALIEAVGFQVARAQARGLPAGERGARLAADAARALGALGDLVLGPLGEDLAGRKRIAIVPTAPLHAGPLAAARVGGRALLENAEVRVVPSAGVLLRLPGVRAGRALVVGVADERAPRAEDEARDVGGALPGALVLAGAAATRSAFVGACIGAGHVHFAGHARFIPSNPGASGLKLADGWLTAGEISRLSLRGASVMLSGCDTGRVVVTGGDEQSGLARAVLAAGASSVTTTLWPVHDETTWGLMTRAYRLAWAESSSSGEGGGPLTTCGEIGPAVRAMQLGLMNAGAHAAAWAGFQTAGSPWHI
jgi:tetratricopeptide (TPR) repeat protein